MVTNNVTVYQFEVGLDEVFADEVRFHVNVDCVIVVVVKDCLFFMSFILCENCEFVKWMCWMLAFLSCIGRSCHQSYAVIYTETYRYDIYIYTHIYIYMCDVQICEIHSF